jgi:C-terminal processing protease CtpA/Prc
MGKHDTRPSERLLASQRHKIFDKTFEKVTKKYFDPNFNGTDWPRLAYEARQQINQLEDPEEFELAMHNLVRKLGTSHTGFFHRSVKRVPARLAIGATLSRLEAGDGRSWAVQDLHAGGPADRAGIHMGDVLVTIGDRVIKPEEQPCFLWVQRRQSVYDAALANRP